MSAERLLLAAWGLWCVLHSLLISNPVLELQRRLLGRRFHIQRLAYVAFSVATITPLIHFTRTLDRTLVLDWEGYGRLIPASGLAVGLLLLLAGGRHYSAGRFLGLTQWRSGNNAVLLSGDDRLDTSGVLGLIRHPWYSGTFFVLWSRDLTGLEIQVNVLLSAYLLVGTWLEERKLARIFGDAYRDYRRRVSRFLPWKWLRTQLGARRSAR